MDISLHYIKKGSGPPLLLLHGNGESGAYFVHQIDEFALRHPGRVGRLVLNGADLDPSGANKRPAQFNRAVLGFLKEGAP